MDPLTNLYVRLRQQGNAPGESETSWPAEPPLLDVWMRYWNDNDSDFGKLGNFAHWLSRARGDA